MFKQIYFLQFITHKSRAKHQGFALIYTMLFVMLIVVTVLVSWATAMAEIRLQNRSGYSVQANQLARAAIEDGFVKYKSEIGNSYDIPNVVLPEADDSINSACETTNPGTYRVYVDSSTPVPVNLQTSDSAEHTAQGFYAYRVCTTGASGQTPGTTTIEGIGYYAGTKVTLQGEVKHPNDIVVDPDPINLIPGSIDHSADTIFIYQTGPSK